MSTPIKNRYDFVVLFDVENGNPNGDPDAGNMPRVDPETGIGLVTDACIKRKIRNYVETVKEDAAGFKIYIKEGVPLNRSDLKAVESLGIDVGDDKNALEDVKKLKKTDEDVDLKLRDYMCSNFYDIRTFGAVLTTFTKAALNCGQVRGPVQIGFAKSIDPVFSQDITVTRVAITTEKDAEKKNTEMGRKSIIPYGLYRVEDIFLLILPVRPPAFLKTIWNCFGKQSLTCLRMTIPQHAGRWQCVSSSYSSITASLAIVHRTNCLKLLMLRRMMVLSFLVNIPIMQ